MEVLLELLACHFSQRVTVRDQFRVKLGAGGLELLKHIAEISFSAGLTIFQSHPVFSQLCPSLLGEFIEFSGEIGTNLVEPIEGTGIGCVVPLNASSKKTALKAADAGPAGAGPALRVKLGEYPI